MHWRCGTVQVLYEKPSWALDGDLLVCEGVYSGTVYIYICFYCIASLAGFD